MALKPWYKVVTPREDLREGRPMDASEFAVHLDQIRDGRAPTDYQVPERFFERTYLTKNLESLAAEVVRRLSGIKTETSAVFNMATQFGGGKTHTLALLYHLANNGEKAVSWPGVSKILGAAGVTKVPHAATAVFVGTEFDSIAGRGGDNGEPLRKTPWGEIAWQLGGMDSFKWVQEHDEQVIAPGNDVIRKILPKDKPSLILMDEMMNYISRFRKMGMATQFYDFLHNLSEEARGQDNVVLVVSIPASELEMTADDQSDYERFKKLLDRLGKAIVISAESETSEIIRRRLFEWTGVPDEAKKIAKEYAKWVTDHRTQIGDFPVDHAEQIFLASYPIHPALLSVFERKWQSLPRFQQTRGVLRLLALWVSHAYQQGFKGAYRDPLITLGTAPLEDTLFRAALFEQLGESRLEAAVTTDIAGKKDAHAIRLDQESVDAIKKSRLHQKVATTIFFESNGGQAHAAATLPEIRIAVAEPELDIGNIETVLESLTESCYYLSVERTRYRFSLSPNLNKLLADKRAIVEPLIKDKVLAEVQAVFKKGTINKVFFPEKSINISDKPILTLVVLPPEQSMSEVKSTMQLIETFTKECGSSGRTFKSGIIWSVPESSVTLKEEARKLLAWENIDGEKDSLRLDDSQKAQLSENLKKSRRDLTEAVWRSYNHVVLLGKDNNLKDTNMGLVHSSSADSLLNYIITRLRQEGDVEESVGPNYLTRNWPPAFKEWNTKSVRDAFFASPKFPRLTDPDSIKATIANGVAGGILAYVGKTADGKYSPFYYEKSISTNDIEISDDMFILKKEDADAYKASLEIKPFPSTQPEPGEENYREGGIPPQKHREDDSTSHKPKPADATSGNDVVTPPIESIHDIKWNGEIPHQKWTNFYMKVLTKLASDGGLKLTLNVEVSNEKGISKQRLEEIKIALRELGLSDDLIFD